MDQVKQAHAAAAAQVKDAPGSLQIHVNAADLRALGATVPAGTPDERPVAIANREYQALVARSAAPASKPAADKPGG